MITVLSGESVGSPSLPQTLTAALDNDGFSERPHGEESGLVVPILETKSERAGVPIHRMATRAASTSKR